MTKILKGITAKEAVNKAKILIKEETSGKQLGLKTSWRKFNIAMRKYVRFKQVILLAGSSGHGKSYILTKILNDFLDLKGINNNFTDKFIILYFCYEMEAETDIIRNVGIKMNVSYNKIIGSEWDKDEKEYLKLDHNEKKDLENHLKRISNRPVFYFETAGNLEQMYNTVKAYSQKYKGYKVITAIDHTLLSLKKDEKSDIDLMANTGKTAIKIKKDFGSMVFMLGQLNNNIENFNRLSNPSNHFPIKSDIYAQSQLYNACDTVMVINQPEKLGLVEYTVKKIPTKNLIHLLLLKNRYGSMGSIWLKNDLANGNIFEQDINNLKKSKNLFED